MSREIKFRGLELEHKYMVFGSLINYDPIPEIQETSLGEMDYDYTTYEVIPESVGQFTGLKDVNGIEIYEGDIIGNDKRIGVVCWNQKNFRYWVETTDKLNDWFLPDSKYKVLGNIHENPELIN